MRPDSALITDLYQLTMMQAYFDHGMDDMAVFDFFVRDMPRRNFLIAAGLEQVIAFLEGLKVEPDEIDYLRGTGLFSDRFLEYLSGFRFRGEVHAMPEGTLFFSNEPILRVTAPLPQAQLVESRIINLLHLQTLIASKAARMGLAAPGKQLVDFGLRRAHGAEAGVLAARAGYIAGLDATATVQAGQLFGIPVSGTMAHSFIEAHDDEAAAFRTFATSQPENTILLIDTYDTQAGAEKVVSVARDLAERGIQIKGVRIDSGDLAQAAVQVRGILDRGGLQDVKILVSGSLDEHRLKALMDVAAPIDGYGIGTRMDTSSDDPYMDCAYKLSEYAGLARRKQSEGKATWPGRKQVFRYYEADGTLARDSLSLETDDQPGQPLLYPMMHAGTRRMVAPDLEQVRRYAQAEMGRLPDRLRALDKADPPYPVQIADPLEALAREVDARLA